MYIVATPSRRRSAPPEGGDALAGVVRMNVRGCSPNRGLRLVRAMAEKRPSPARASCALVMSPAPAARCLIDHRAPVSKPTSVFFSATAFRTSVVASTISTSDAVT